MLTFCLACSGIYSDIIADIVSGAISDVVSYTLYGI